MTTMNISLPAQMKSWAESRTKNGRYGNVSDYVRDLIRRDQQRAEAIAELQSLVDKAVTSGIGEKSFDQIIEEAAAGADGRGLA